jgi:hypothetical protein
VDADIEFFRAESPLALEIRSKKLINEYVEYLKRRNVIIDWPSNGHPAPDGFEIVKRRYLLENLAYLRSRADLAASSSNHLIALRTEIICKLKLSEMWHEPWTNLVDMALPSGGDYSHEILGAITPPSGSVSGGKVSAHALATTMLGLLGESSNDHISWLTVFELSLLALLTDHPTKRYLPQKLRRDAEDVIRRHNNTYPHPGWARILDSYFPQKWKG